MLHDIHETLAGGGKLTLCQSHNIVSCARRHVCRGGVPTWELPIPAWLDKGYI
jgi:hypothetical protein